MLAAVFVILAGELILATQKRTPNASGDDMEEAGLAFSNDVTAWIGHDAIVAGRKGHAHRKIPRLWAGNFRCVPVLKFFKFRLSRSLSLVGSTR